MPPLITGSSFYPGTGQSYVTADDLERLNRETIAEYRKRYPKVGKKPIDLKPGSELHDLIRNEIIQRAFVARMALRVRFDSWRKLDQVLTAYIPTDEEERRLQAVDSRKPVSIVIPQGYATKETFQTYFAAALLEDPIYRYSGVGPEDVIGAILLEHLMSHQARKFKHGLKWDAALGDGITYGFGKLAMNWRVKHGFRSELVETAGVDDDGNELPAESVRKSERRILYEGNGLTVCSPYLALPDPNMAVEDLQEGEFDGYCDTTTYMGLLEQELVNEDLFNVRYIEAVGIDGRSFLSKEAVGGRDDKKGGATRNKPGLKTRPVDLIMMQINLIPSEWKTEDGLSALGDSDYPEKWEFVLAGDSVVVKAKRMDYDHDMFTSVIVAPTASGHDAAPVSILEIGYPMEHAINFLWNIHFKNKRKTANNVYVLNPKMVNEFDLDHIAEAGGKIRLRQAAWQIGKWQDHIGQLPVADVTASNLNDMGFLIDIENNSLGTVDQARGVIRPRGERVSAEEVRGARGSALSRLERIARLCGQQGVWDAAYIGASHTKQFMSEKAYIKVTGELVKTLTETYGIKDIKNGRLEVTPENIDIDYDVIGSDGAIPYLQGDSQTMVQLMQQAAVIPALLARIDWVKAFIQSARAAGFKTANDWVVPQANVQVMGNEQVAAQVQAGNLMPV